MADKTQPEVRPPLRLTVSERDALLTAARQALEDQVGGASATAPPLPVGALAEPVKVFVSLHEDGQLRGCIGLVEGAKPLWEVTREMAVAAGTRDPRFPPLSAEELPRIEIEISVLGPMVEVPPENLATLDRWLEPGVHGALLRRGEYSGLLLPQVATNYLWDATEFLCQTAVKAGLEPGDWKRPGTRIWLFRVDHFGEMGDAAPP